MNGPIYRPKGRAREYAPLALNYYDGCSGGCLYCYTEGLWPGFSTKAPEEIGVRKGFKFEALEEQLKTFHPGPLEYVLLSFAGDPYCPSEDEHQVTRKVLELFFEHRIPTRILTKQGTRCLRDVPIFKRFMDAGISLTVGQSLTFSDIKDSMKWEPGCASPDERLTALDVLHENWIPTWASFEPVIVPAQSLDLMERGLTFIDHYAIGKLNHNKAIEDAIDWKTFGQQAVEMMKKNGKSFIIKKDLVERMEA
jgi:DNA repair photolyase